MGPGTVSLTSNLEPAAIHLDHRKGRSRAHSWGERLGLETAEMIITISLELLADLVGNPADLPLADSPRPVLPLPQPPPGTRVPGLRNGRSCGVPKGCSHVM